MNLTKTDFKSHPHKLHQGIVGKIHRAESRSHLLRSHGQARVSRDILQSIQPTLVLGKQRREGAASRPPSAADGAPAPPSDFPPPLDRGYECNFHRASRLSDSLVVVTFASAGAGAAVVVARVTVWAMAGLPPCLGRPCRGRRTRECRWCVVR